MKKTERNISMFLIGVLMNSFGIWLIVLSALGTNPIDAVAIGLFNQVGFTIGTWFNFMSGVLIMAAAIISKTKPNLISFLISVSFGLLFDLLGFIVFNNLLVIELHFILRIIIFVSGILSSAVGVSLYIASGYPVSALENLMLAIKERFGWTLNKSRLAMEAALTITALLVKGPIALGTIILVFGFSKTLDIVSNQISIMLKNV